ncbi:MULTISPECIES: flagellar biosynthetic protein FliQ [Ruegeria]|jgi:flagellar biosynthetic protein FliQ|uniref:Flagellar biosynthetic protein FliQ n=1 Tax=Ruegeria atlantica TaxID=81569 RepID=A0AA90Z1S9_9RHOB|nr:MULTISPECIES: flagellar biosynthetic protein FliQ [Ruegeria]MCA0907794.1 flagellar biosynthetic protein FliQ [Ruegeria marisrubri]NOC45968.1 flagellar biosynthetic protein FliQ [Ruegeria sp. HKCCD7559]NOD84801.1 flagellar biosynthetic protein FliQ [Ruegeria sp. HKCCD6119]NOD99142.1 flagellar biosynthetic protein FliQ [Ruegeria sp. HKCCD6228]NOE20340.1 flagellar biosynthetic protein FliQ [Ruegeria atlantica]
MLSEGLFYDIVRQALWIAVITSVPILAVALVSGLIVGLFQALTSIQEMTLTFVPKLIAIVVVFWISMGFMTQTLVTFFTGTLVPLIAGGR